MSFTSDEETKKYNNIRKIKYSTTEQKTKEVYTKTIILKMTTERLFGVEY